MPTVAVLINGYVHGQPGARNVTCTTTLIQDNGINVIVDPGMDKPKLLAALQKHQLTPADIHYVMVTHNHKDHYLLTGLFPDAKVIDGDDIFDYEGHMSTHEGTIPGTSIQIIKTPGHSPDHCSLLVQTQEHGMVCVAADVFWWMDAREQKTDRKSLLALQDPFVQDEKALLESRKKVLEAADYIIPGHGKAFVVERG